MTTKYFFHSKIVKFSSIIKFTIGIYEKQVLFTYTYYNNDYILPDKVLNATKTIGVGKIATSHNHGSSVMADNSMREYNMNIPKLVIMLGIKI